MSAGLREASTSLRGCIDELSRRHRLADVALGVLGRMKQQPDDGGWYPVAPDQPFLRQGRGIGAAQLIQRPLQRSLERAEEIVGGEIRIRLRFLRQHQLLRVGQPRASGIREQPIETAKRVQNVKADRGGVSGAAPDQIDRHAREQPLDFFTALQQAVRHRLQQRGDAFGRPSQPYLAIRHGSILHGPLQLHEIVVRGVIGVGSVATTVVIPSRDIMQRRFAVCLAVASIVTLTGCLARFRVGETAAPLPEFRPEQFFAGATHGDGVLATRGRADRAFQVTGTGHGEPDGTFVLDQTLTYADRKVERRSFRMRRVAEHQYTATLTGASGRVSASIEGNSFHLRYTIGRPSVTMEQWIYLQPDGRTALNRGTVRVLGVPIAHLSETITRQ